MTLRTDECRISALKRGSFRAREASAAVSRRDPSGNKRKAGGTAEEEEAAGLDAAGRARAKSINPRPHRGGLGSVGAVSPRIRKRRGRSTKSGCPGNRRGWR